MRYQRPKQASIVPTMVFFFLGMFSGVNLFFIMSFFFFIQFVSVNGANKIDNEKGRRKKQQQTASNRNVVKRKTKRKLKSNPFKTSGLKKYKEYDIPGAIEDFNEGLELEPESVPLHFNLACAYSLSEDKDKGFYHLQQAVENGYQEFDKIMSHDDLAYLRIQPEFDAFKKSGYRKLSKAAATKDAESAPNDALLAHLNKLAELRKRGLLSDNEFQREKEKLLNKR